MAVYLVQHGLARAKEEDPERSLSVEGADKVRLIAEVAANYAVTVDTILHSGKKRAEQTAEIFAQALKPANGCGVQAGIGPKDDVTVLAAGLLPQSNTMYVGHLPFMEKLVSELVTGTVEYTPFRFQNGGIVCLDQDEGELHWYVKWALMPNIS